jgi:hypothetical protein
MSLCWPLSLWAGGPLYAGSSTFGVDAQPFTWNPAAMPIRYRVDGGPMAATASGQAVVSNASGVSRVASMFQTWQSVTTATLSSQNAGAILGVTGFSDGDVSTAAEFNAVYGSCQAGTQSPIIFDANGNILTQLGVDPGAIIGFSAQCSFSSSGFITADLILMNGAFQNGGTGPEISANQFNEAITHEIGHFLGLDHSQINLNEVFNQSPDNCSVDVLAGLPLMFPFLYCQARPDAGLPKLAPDDMAWISRLYPRASFGNSYATISGTVFFSDGEIPAQDVNVIARRVDNPSTPEDESLRVAVSAVSGYRFTGNPGQSVTANYLPCTPPGQNGCPASGYLSNNSAGSRFGSRNVVYAGAFDIPVPAGASYTVEVESIYPYFIGGSGAGPLDFPIPLPGGLPEFWDSNESPFDDPSVSTVVPTSPGEVVSDHDIILNGTQPKFDLYEDGGAQLRYQDAAPWLREEDDTYCREHAA